jgi:hypothetical protein
MHNSTAICDPKQVRYLKTHAWLLQQDFAFKWAFLILIP